MSHTSCANCPPTPAPLLTSQVEVDEKLTHFGQLDRGKISAKED